MAPKKRGASANAKPVSKKEKKTISNGAGEEPKEDGKPTSNYAEEEQPPTKKPRRSNRNTSVSNGKETGEEETEVVVENNVPVNAGQSKDIVIEHCKQCQCFKVRALKVEKELKGAIPDVEVTINPEKPRRGCFEIRDGKGNIFLSFQNLPRPFTKLKQHDLDGTISEIIEKIK
ncbi:hypothetical protein KI387_041451 [Taxus chinensis]|uniref:Selenoprotein H n=1 Tax=Taxus chinensis TaxID=29808 RepID=A0AA38C3K2_TAXCH|nr:hypothetical protein KI387_041451 [Taxus chinensis]